MSETVQLWSVLLGAILSTFGGAAVIWVQAKFARRTRMDELIAEKKVEANKQAYSRIKVIESMLVQAKLEDVAKQMQMDEQ